MRASPGRPGIRVLRALVCAGAAAVLAGPIALANMANPLQPGDQVGEPSAALRSVAVDHEDLTLDLTGLGRAPASGSIRNGMM